MRLSRIPLSASLLVLLAACSPASDSGEAVGRSGGTNATDGGSGTGGTTGSAGGAGNSGGGAGSTGGATGTGGTSVPAPVDCSAIAAHTDWSLCVESDDRCEAVFEDSAGCMAVCAAAGLVCEQVFEDGDACTADTTRPELSCDPPSGHQSDYCVCARGTCVPNCAGKQCGDDGCGGSCGPCSGTCTPDGQCLGCAPLTCDKAMLQCGTGHDDGCSGTFDCAGSCPSGLPCNGGQCGAGPTTCVPGNCPAFPGAEGEGRFAAGGRGGDVYHVTTVNDTGAGSLRDGVSSGSGARTVVFDVAGIIDLKSPLRINRANLTLAGQTAPGQGIVIRGYQVDVRADDVIIQHLRFRAGDIHKKTSSSDGFTEDSLTINGKNIIVDHVSASWGIDECLSGGSAFENLTVQYCIIAEGLYHTKLFHGEYDPNHPGHSMGSLFKPSDGDGNVSVHHNLYAHNNNRNPAIGTYDTNQRMRADIRNNVIYDCPTMGYTSGASERIEMNYVGNYGVFGPDSNHGELFNPNTPNNVRIFQTDNRIDKSKNGAFDGVDQGWSMFGPDGTHVSSPFTFEPVTTQAADIALPLVLEQAGALPWARDSVDVRVVASVHQSTGGLIDSQDDVGGWGSIDPGSPVVDTDRDGMPDGWESVYGTDPSQPDNNGDQDGDGYTNLEAYLHWAARPR